jgi:hypothetical protein
MRLKGEMPAMGVNNFFHEGKFFRTAPQRGALSA